MEQVTELPVSLPGLHAARVTTTALHVGMKERYGVGRVERGHSEWWSAGKVWRSGPGSILVKEPGDVHRDLARDGPTTVTAVALPKALIEEARAETRAVVLSHLTRDDERAAPFHRLLDAVCAGADELDLDVAAAEAAAAMTRVVSLRPRCTQPVARAMKQLRDRLDESLSLDDLARHARVDKFHLCRAFRDQIGMPPHAYRTHLRVARAKELLRRGTPAAKVAPLVGFYDQAQLTRHFRRIVGTTPGRFAAAHGPWFRHRMRPG